MYPIYECAYFFMFNISSSNNSVFSMGSSSNYSFIMYKKNLLLFGPRSTFMLFLY